LAIPRGPDAIDQVLPALASALDGGPAVLPLPDGPPALRESIESALRPDEPPDGEAALIVPTSGSTGSPRGVLLPAAAIRASAAATHTRLGGAGRWLLALPPTHVAGLMVLARSVVAGTAPVALDLRRGFDPAAFVTASARLRGDLAARRYTALVPTQLAALLDAPGESVAALAEYDAVLIGGATAPDALVERAREAGVNVVTTYGMTETCGGCVYDGVPLDGVEVDVQPPASAYKDATAAPPTEPSAPLCNADPNAPDTELGPVGLIRVSGSVLASGYRLRPDLTAEAFAGSWFRTSDLGVMDNGVLQITGRADDVAISGGVNVPLAAIDTALAEVPGVRDAAATAVADQQWGQRIVAVVVPRDPSNPPTLESIRSAMSHAYPPAYIPKELILVPSLPMLPSGKVDRRALTDLR
jgi:O-succinylbenzoic acid--CoA ligase